MCSLIFLIALSWDIFVFDNDEKDFFPFFFHANLRNNKKRFSTLADLMAENVLHVHNFISFPFQLFHSTNIPIDVEHEKVFWIQFIDKRHFMSFLSWRHKESFLSSQVFLFFCVFILRRKKKEKSCVKKFEIKRNM